MTIEKNCWFDREGHTLLIYNADRNKGSARTSTNWKLAPSKFQTVMAVVILKTSEYTKADRCGVENTSRETKTIE